jgi:hypothetical protein
MKGFLVKALIFSLICLVGINVRPTYLLIHEKYKATGANAAIYYSINKSKTKSKAKKLLLGDSVGNQLFYNYTTNEPINSLACNKAIGIVGQYFLVYNYLKAGNKIDTLYMVFNPGSFKNNLDELYTYNYFIKPFYISEYEPLYTKTVSDQLNKIPYINFRSIPYILTSNWSPRYKSSTAVDYTFMSPISAEYLAKIRDLSVEHNFRLIILPPPVSISRKSEVDGIDKDELFKYGLSELFNNYFKQIIYLNDSSFVDGVHLKNPLDYKDRILTLPVKSNYLVKYSKGS